ncbi:hypothetical protein ACH4UM_18925 [Streptomyces sp. NPDC020801]|uniref:hypothetical protein n=1 Tax=Streptomyces sp. NPDC020801 TaxID=3365093 RepID=UPI0037B14046
MSAYQDLMTALATRRPGQSAAEDERLVLAALATHAHELAEQQRGLTVYELDWAPGSHQWQCPRCGSVGNVTPRMASTPGPWHHCRATAPSAGPVRPDEEPT